MKQKQILLKMLLLAPVLTGLLSLARPVHAASVLQRIINGMGEILLALVGNILSLLSSIVANIILPFVYQLIDSFIIHESLFLDSTIKMGGTTPAAVTQEIWSFTMLIANGIFLLALIIASIAIILRVNTGIYNIKKILGGLILAIILSNSSLLIVKTVLALGSQLTVAVTGLLGSNPGTPSQLIQDIYISVTEIGGPLVFAPYGAPTIVYVVAVVLLLTLGVKLAFILAQRIVWIFFLIISAPLAFALSILPATEELAKKWWQALLRWVLIFPVMMFLLTIAKKIIDSAGGVDTIFKWAPPATAGNNFTLSPDLLMVIAGLTVMYFAGQVDKHIKLDGVMGSGNVSKGIGAIKDVGSKVSKTSRNIYDRGKREVQAGSLDRVNPKLKKGAVKAQAWWDRNNILNQGARKNKQEADVKRKVALQTFGNDVKKTQKQLVPFDAAAQDKYQKNWFDLDNKQQEYLLNATEGDVEGAPKKYSDINKAKKTKLNDSYGTMMWAARKFSHDTNIADIDPANSLEQELLDFEDDGEGGEKAKDQGKGVLAAINLSRIATSNNHPEKALAQEILTRNREVLQEKYGLNASKLIKMKPPKAKDAPDTDIRLANAKTQLATSKTDEGEAREQLSAYGLNENQAKTIVKNGVPPSANNLSTINTDTLDELAGKDLSASNPERKNIIARAASEMVSDDKPQTELIASMLNSGMSIEDIKMYKKLDEAQDDEGNPPDLKGLLKKISGAETSQNQSEKIISETEEIHRKKATDVTRVVDAKIVNENRTEIHTTVKAQYENILTRVVADPTIQKMGDLNLSAGDKEAISTTLDKTGSALDFNEKMDDVAVGEMLNKLRIVKDVTASPTTQ